MEAGYEGTRNGLKVIGHEEYLLFLYKAYTRRNMSFFGTKSSNFYESMAAGSGICVVRFDRSVVIPTTSSVR